MSCALSNTTRVLKSCSKFFSTNLRFCSSASKFGTSNKNFPGFSTKDSLQTFEKSPSMKIIANVILYGACVSPKSYIFAEKIDATSLIEGCVHAVEAVTQDISTENNESMDSLFTRDCLNRFRDVVPSKENLKHIGIDKEDILFYWLKNFSEENTMKIQIGILHFPSYHYMKEGIVGRKQKQKDIINEVSEEVKSGQVTFNEGWKIQNERMKEERDNEFDVDKADKHYENNDIIVSNWDFVQEDGDWKIDGIVMQNMSKLLAPPFYFRWKSRAKTSIGFGKDYIKVLRYDWATDYIFATIFLNLFMVSLVASAVPVVPPVS